MSDASDTSDDAGRAGEVHSPGKSWPQREVPRHGGAQLICLEAGRGGAWLHNVCVCGSVIVFFFLYVAVGCPSRRVGGCCWQRRRRRCCYSGGRYEKRVCAVEEVKEM